MWGGTPQRNMVNTVEKNIPDSWDIETGRNVKWIAQLGSQSYGNAIVAGGKVFLGTNNQALRQPKAKGDKGVVMCFAEKDGTFLWQLTHDKLAAGRVNDWPQQGICSSGCVEGNRLFYVSNRCELVCADTEGFYDGKNDGPFTAEKLTDKIDGDIVWKLDMIKELGVFSAQHVGQFARRRWRSGVPGHEQRRRRGTYRHPRAQGAELHRRR